MLPLLNMLRMRSVPNKNTKISHFWFTFSKQRRIWSFHVAVLQTAKKCTKNYNALAQLLFCSSNLLFGGVVVVVAVAVEVCVRSLLWEQRTQALSLSLSSSLGTEISTTKEGKKSLGSRLCCEGFSAQITSFS